MVLFVWRWHGHGGESSLLCLVSCRGNLSKISIATASVPEADMRLVGENAALPSCLSATCHMKLESSVCPWLRPNTVPDENHFCQLLSQLRDLHELSAPKCTCNEVQSFHDGS